MSRELRVMEAHLLKDCPIPAACWYEPHRGGGAVVTGPDSEGQADADVLAAVSIARQAVVRDEVEPADYQEFDYVTADQSPVVPSVGAVPVEVPEEAEFDFTLTNTIAEAVLNGPGEWIGNGMELAALASVVREKVKPLIAARVRAEERQRIANEGRLTEMVLLTERCTDRSCGRLRYGELTDDLNTHWHVKKGVSLVAAGSAVPVVTPPADDGFELCEHGVIGPHTYGEDMEDQVAWRDCPGKRRPVATPTEPAHDHQPDRACPRCDDLNRRDGELHRVGKSPVLPAEPDDGPATEARHAAEHDGQLATMPEPIDLLTALQRSIDRARGVVEQDGAGPARSSAALNCDTCDDTGAVRMEYDGSPGSGGWFSCPDCMPTPSVPVDEPVEQDGQR